MIKLTLSEMGERKCKKFLLIDSKYWYVVSFCHNSNLFKSWNFNYSYKYSQKCLFIDSFFIFNS